MEFFQNLNVQKLSITVKNEPLILKLSPRFLYKFMTSNLLVFVGTLFVERLSNVAHNSHSKAKKFMLMLG